MTVNQLVAGSIPASPAFLLEMFMNFDILLMLFGDVVVVGYVSWMIYRNAKIYHAFDKVIIKTLTETPEQMTTHNKRLVMALDQLAENQKKRNEQQNKDVIKLVQELGTAINNTNAINQVKKLEQEIKKIEVENKSLKTSISELTRLIKEIKNADV